ncbi:hypothetical protein KS08_08870 [Bacillus subtilis]|nr:hypothetical protein KS08_08870 [Bacillus subtilis]
MFPHGLTFFVKSQFLFLNLRIYDSLIIEAMIEETGLANSYVEESFLEDELTNALDKSGDYARAVQ